MPKILFFTPHPIEDGGSRYRVYQFVPYLEAAGYQCTVWPFSTPALFRVLRRQGEIPAKLTYTAFCTVRRLTQIARVRRFDWVVIHREVFPFLIPAFERLVLAQNSRVIFSFDDAVYAGHEDASRLNHPLLYGFKYGNGIAGLVRRSAHVIAGNNILADYARRHNPNVTVIPTVVDCAAYKCRAAQSVEGGPVTIGWTGSRTTAVYLPMIEDALKRVAAANPGRVRFRFFGHPQYRLDVPDFVSSPFSLATEIDDLSQIDVGVMPIPDNPWTRGKCAFKAVQYMALGRPAVASPVGMTTELIQHGENGFLADSSEEWFQALNRLVNDAALRRRMSVAARQTIEDGYSLQVWAPRFVSLFGHEEGVAAVSERASYSEVAR